ncbi:helix-turn-helix domain-containing protein [Streptomyces sp. Ac-502]|uniref:helix-turn-helix domain-containing protein n=1 Tax=Streptomyces sp. Ac-502 TaxID=3342801 RepID=UPI0038625C41
MPSPAMTSGLRPRGRDRLWRASDPLRPIGSPAMPVRTACPHCLSDSPERRRTRAVEEDGLRPRDRAPTAGANAGTQVVLHAARGRSNARIAQETGLRLDTARRRRGRFVQEGFPGLKDRRR